MSDQDSDRLEQHTIYGVGSAAPLVLGCDREMVMLSALLSVVIAYAGGSLMFIALACLMFFVLVRLLRIMAKADPRMRFKAIRHIKLASQSVYRARATPFGRTREQKDW